MRLLIITFKFPPYGGVGSFRWSKFSKYLAKSGHKINVLTIRWNDLSPNNLNHDIKHKGIDIIRIKSGYPHNLKFSNSNSKILNLLKIVFFKIYDFIFFWDDEAQNWGKYLIPAANKLLRNNSFDAVIATGAPFHTNYWASKIKQQFPGLFLVQDFRDPWIQNPYKKYTYSRRKIVLERFKETLEYSDLNITVTPSLINEYEKFNGKNTFKLLTNGFDINDIPCQKFKKNYKTFDFIHIGSITNGRDEACIRFLNEIQFCEIKNYRIILVGNTPRIIRKKFKYLIQEKKLILQKTVSQKEAIIKVAQSNVAIHLGSPKFPYALSTKIFEYMGISKPVLSVNYGGDIVDILKNYKAGISVNINEDNSEVIQKKINQVIQLENENKLLAKNYSYDFLTKKLIELIKREKREKHQ